MRVAFSYDLTDELVREGNRVLTRHLLRGLSWPWTLGWWGVSVAVLAVAVLTHAAWIWQFLAGVTTVLFFLVFVVTFVMPGLQKGRLEAYIRQLQAWPHRRIEIALTPDALELTTPTGHGLVELGELQQVVHDPAVTVLVFRGGAIIQIPTEVIPEEARRLLRFPGSDKPAEPAA